MENPVTVDQVNIIGNTGKENRVAGFLFAGLHVTLGSLGYVEGLFDE